MGKLIILGNQKGGCGKSTLTTLFASELHAKGYNVLVVDTDYQRSIHKVRERELEEIEDDSNLYDVIYKPSSKASEYIDFLINDYDYIFCDVPGNITEDGVRKMMFSADMIVVVHDPSLYGYNASVEYLTSVDDLIKTGADFKIMNIISKFSERKKIVKDYIKYSEKISEHTWFNKHFRDLSIFENATTVGRYKHSKYQYEFDMMIEQFINEIK